MMLIHGRLNSLGWKYNINSPVLKSSNHLMRKSFERKILTHCEFHNTPKICLLHFTTGKSATTLQELLLNESWKHLNILDKYTLGALNVTTFFLSDNLYKIRKNTSWRKTSYNLRLSVLGNDRHLKF